MIRGKGMILNDRQTVFCTVVQGNAEGGIIVARSIHNTVKLITVLPQRT